MNCGPENPATDASSSVTAGVVGGVVGIVIVVGGVVGIVVVVVVLVVLAAAAAITWKVRRKHLHSSRLHLEPEEGAHLLSSYLSYECCVPHYSGDSEYVVHVYGAGRGHSYTLYYV